MLLDNTGTHRSHKPSRSHSRLHREHSNRSHNPRKKHSSGQIRPPSRQGLNHRDPINLDNETNTSSTISTRTPLTPRLTTPSPLPIPLLLSGDMSQIISNMVSTPPSTVTLAEEVNHPPTDPVSHPTTQCPHQIRRYHRQVTRRHPCPTPPPTCYQNYSQTRYTFQIPM